MSNISSDNEDWAYWWSTALPETKNCDGRPIWEPPIFDYSDLIGEEFEKKKEAVLKFTQGDVVRTTEIMDELIDWQLMWSYGDWAEDNRSASADGKCRLFFGSLQCEVTQHYTDANEALWHLGAHVEQNDNGTWVAMTNDEWEFWRKSRNPDHEAEAQLDTATWSTSSTAIYGGDSDISSKVEEAEAANRSPTEDAPCFPTQISAVERVGVFQQLQTQRSRARSLSPNWRILAPSSVSSTAHPQSTLQTTPLAMRLMALRTSTDESTQQMKERLQGDDID